MSDIAIRAENISKAYQLGEIGTGTISNDLQRWFARVRGKEDPFLQVGETNDRTIRGKSDIVWSLKDINFDINRGDAVGIIGRNGAGKSTLLKLLSRVTAPTTGTIKVKGRIASLLEVGTGFHPDLTGRENIFLNGAILGMRRYEIKSQFDAIVDFAGVERYIDTPVKRYSSGMYVRLAFAVAAHLDSEILIVDEVLAVGDYEFQKKCLGKMKAIGQGEGKTVLFVSHNMGSIKNLCSKGIYLKNGILQQTGNIDTIISHYQKDLSYTVGDEQCEISFEPSPKQAYISHLSISNEHGLVKQEFDVFEQVVLNIKYFVNEPTLGFSPLIDIKKDGIDMFYSLLSDIDETVLEGQQPGEYNYRVKLHSPLKKGRYTLTFRLSKLRVGDVDGYEDILTFYVDEFSFDPTNKSYASFRKGLVASIFGWEKL
ncbi:ATP-binding cassette domain-containing protein [Mucilaginibacter limnophilus]|uniref:ATP-binding cassette domain-containing protein n=1 Tax=Mucilaginibacter limnophilus TaxID=1932778 RepID=A0A3S2UMX5_9SPHI|nr:ABC transporter ATP-binding protein [Mucilaginibacter limnophilus]RVU01630.1 ATP-binding cassette domain-containing protein [Mucilaginibacter limnophilus]